MKPPFIVGDRVKTQFRMYYPEDATLWKESDMWSHGTITGIEGKIAIVLFDDLKHLGISLREMAWRIERLEFETTVDLGEEYFY